MLKLIKRRGAVLNLRWLNNIQEFLWWLMLHSFDIIADLENVKTLQIII